MSLIGTRPTDIALLVFVLTPIYIYKLIEIQIGDKLDIFPSLDNYRRLFINMKIYIIRFLEFY